MESKILVVDDDPAVLKVMLKLLEAFGHTTVSATGGYEAFKILENSSDIHFVITDMRMAQGDGIELLDSMKKADLHIPTLLISGYADQVESDALEKGAIGVMTKPFDIDKLMLIIDEHTKH